jgi:hypothetical protein
LGFAFDEKKSTVEVATALLFVSTRSARFTVARSPTETGANVFSSADLDGTWFRDRMNRP